MNKTFKARKICYGEKKYYIYIYVIEKPGVSGVAG